MHACAADDGPSRAPQRDRDSISLGRISVEYPSGCDPSGCDPPRISVAGRPLSIDVGLPEADATAFACEAGPGSVLIADRDERTAVLVPRDRAALLEGQTPVYLAGPDPRHSGRFCVKALRSSPAAGVLYVAQAFGHTTGWVPAVHGALTRLDAALRFTAAIRRPEDADHARRKADGDAGRMHVVPLHYCDEESATITADDVANPSRPALHNREAALLWIADNLELARASAGAAALVNDCRPETWILHQLAEHAQGREVPLHAVRYAFAEFPWLRRLVLDAKPPAPAGVDELLAASAPAIHTRRALDEALRASGIDARRSPSVDFEAASRAIIARMPARGTVWYQAVHWRDRLDLETDADPYVVVPPLGQPSSLSPEQAAVSAGALLARLRPDLATLFAPEDPRGVVLVAQGNGHSACSRRHWRGMLAAAARMEETQFLFAGGTAEDRAWLAELRPRCPTNVTLLGWMNEAWTTFLRALAARPRTAFVCRPGLSSIGTALVNGVPPLLMPPDPLERIVDPVTAEVAMERAVYAFQLDRLYTARCAEHRASPLPILVDTLGGDPGRPLATLRRALDPATQARQRTAIAGYCRWSRVAHLLASVLAREAVVGPLPMHVKRRLRDHELLPAESMDLRPSEDL